MGEVLGRAFCFIALIFMGVLLRRVGFFQEEDFHLLSKIVVKITLTAAIVRSFAGQEIQSSMVFLTLLGFLFGVILIVLGIVLNLRQSSSERAFALLNLSGCNIGNFVLPFSQGFLSHVGVMAVSLFDMGNAFICLGGAFAVATTVKDKSTGFSLKPILKAFSRSAPLIAYVTMVILSLLHIPLPSVALTFAETVAGANSFLAMLMIGIGFRMPKDVSRILAAAKILSVRFFVGITLAAVCWFTPLALPYRQALVICLLAPITTAAPAFTAELKGDHQLASTINSLSILISIVLITGALTLIL